MQSIHFFVDERFHYDGDVAHAARIEHSDPSFVRGEGQLILFLWMPGQEHNETTNFIRKWFEGNIVGLQTGQV